MNNEPIRGYPQPIHDDVVLVKTAVNVVSVECCIPIDSDMEGCLYS